MNHNRFVFLDGLRGIAAVFVLVRHTYFFWGMGFFRSYLAVDIFFILSGFVIACAYDERVKNGLSVSRFMAIRLIRLYPVFLLSLVICIGNIIIIGYPAEGGQAPSHHKLVEVASSIAMASLFLPFHLAGNSRLFPVNLPYWSLFFELTANAIYAVMRPVLTTFLLAEIVGVSGTALAAIALYRHNLDLGYTWSSEAVLSAFIRSVFGIFMGLLLYRGHQAFGPRLAKVTSPWLGVAGVVLVLGAPDAGDLEPLVQALGVTVVFPVCVLVAAQGAQTRMVKVLALLGLASYPVYVLQMPVEEFLTHYFGGALISVAPLGGIAVTIGLIAVSVPIARYYDEPVRRWLSRQLARWPDPSAKRVDAVDAASTQRQAVESLT